MPSYLIYKPYGMLSQFSKENQDQSTLADLDFEFEKNVYPIGRLDADSEGLLLLSSEAHLNAAILQPKQQQSKTYWAQVEGAPTIQDLKLLETGIDIRSKGKTYRTLSAKIKILHQKPELPPRIPDIRFRKNIPDTWIAISIYEGKNRQVRKMLAAVGFPVLRLVRAQLLDYELGKGICKNMQAGAVLPVNIQLPK